MSTGIIPGRIVYVEMLDPQGRNPKRRPGVVRLLLSDGTVEVIAITSKLELADPAVTVEIPWQRGGHPRTRLSAPGGAVCNWALRVPVSSIPTDALGGFVPAAALYRINVITENILSLIPLSTDQTS